MAKYHFDMGEAKISNQQIGDGNTQYMMQVNTADISSKEWLQLEHELYQMLKQNRDNEIFQKSYNLVEHKDNIGIKNFFSKHMPTFVRDVMVNLTADGLLILCKVLFNVSV